MPTINMTEITPQENCVIDARVSTEKQLLGTGLDNQLETCQFLIKSRNWLPVLVYTKPYSGRKEEREDFKEILADIRALQKSGTTVHYYVFASIDRLTRRGSEGFLAMKREILKLGVEPIDTRGIIQPEQNTLEHHGFEYSWSTYSPTETAQLLEAERAKSEVRDMLTRLIGAEISLTKQGYSMRSCADGYRIAKKVEDGKKRPVLATVEKRAKYYRKMFRYRARAHLTDKEIADQINAEGFLTKPQNRWAIIDGREKKIVGKTRPKPLSVKRMQERIKNPIYAGVKLEKWNDGVPVWARFADGSKPIIDIETFNIANRGAVHIKVQKDGQPQVLYNYTERQRQVGQRQKFRREYQFDKMVLCAVCRRPLFNSGRGNRGRHGTYYKAYHCARTDECKRVTGRIPKAKFEATVSSVLSSLTGAERFAEKLGEAVKRAYRRRAHEIKESQISIDANVEQLKRQQEALLESYYATTSSIVREKTEARIEELEKQIDLASQKQDREKVKESDIRSFAQYVKKILEHIKDTLADNRFPFEQRAFFGLVFDSCPTWQEFHIGTPNLSPVFKLSEQFKRSKSDYVGLDGLDWNTIEETILKWNSVIEQNDRIKKLAESTDRGPAKRVAIRGRGKNAAKGECT